MKRNRTSIAWAAGLFEGEGCFSYSSNGRRPSKENPEQRNYIARATLSMTDEDVVRKFHAVLGFGRTNPKYKRPGKWKPVWTWCAAGHEKVQATIALFWEHLGERRKKKAREVLESAIKMYFRPKKRPGFPLSMREQRDTHG